MKGVRKTIHRDREIWIIDFSGCNEAATLELITNAKRLIEQEKKPVRLLVVLREKNYITTAIKQQGELIHEESYHLIEKHAIVGLSAVQEWIIKGLNLFRFKKPLMPFNSVEEALDYLAD